ncbi:MAG TPA: HD-GYP domain-containing protein [Nitrospira sp.]|nr:HD-GYP domain-containing protein [Nitrospira sp.]HMV57980.1 HD-GYP domain-containing protein [Nitrospira sp.]
MTDSPSPVNPAPSNTDAAHPILTHERSLANKIAKGSEAGDILDQQLAMLGIQLVTQLNVLIKTSRIHGRTNAALDKPVDSMLTLVKTLAADHPVALRLQNDFLFLGDSHLKMSSQQMAVFASIIEALNKWHIGGVSFASTAESKDYREFAYLFVSLDPEKHTLADLQEALQTAGVNGIELEEPRALQLQQSNDADAMAGEGGTRVGSSAGGQENSKEKRKAIAKGRYAKAASALGDLTKSTRAGGTVSFKQAKRAIQNIVELMMQDESTLLGLTNLRCHDQYTHNHSVNVSLLAMALGNRAGYPKVDLADLGLSALFHDVGKCAISLDVLNKPGEFTQDEWAIMRSHPIEGVFTLVKARGINNVPARMASASFEHHMNYDFSGYPKLKVPWSQTVASRIITIADCYDAMTSSRVYRREPMSPANVLKFMFGKSGQSFDPVLLKLFVNCVGIIPIGSLVRLDSGPLAVVIKPAQDKANAERPMVRVITDTEGTPIEDGPELDLAAQDDTGTYTHNILQLVDNAEYHFDTGRYFV